MTWEQVDEWMDGWMGEFSVRGNGALDIFSGMDNPSFDQMHWMMHLAHF